MESVIKIVIWLAILGLAFSALGIIFQIVVFGTVGIGALLWHMACAARRNWLVCVAVAGLALIGVLALLFGGAI